VLDWFLERRHLDVDRSQFILAGVERREDCGRGCPCLNGRNKVGELGLCHLTGAFKIHPLGGPLVDDVVHGLCQLRANVVDRLRPREFRLEAREEGSICDSIPNLELVRANRIAVPRRLCAAVIAIVHALDGVTAYNPDGFSADPAVQESGEEGAPMNLGITSP